MKTSSIALSCLLTASVSGCNKDHRVTEPVTSSDAGTTPAELQPTPAEPMTPAQDPDPPQLGQAMDKFLLGHYEEVSSLVEPIAAASTEDSQIRARAIASSLHALAQAQDLPENAIAPAEIALECAQRLRDDEVTALAQMAMAAYHKGVLEYDEAAVLLDAAVDLEQPHQALARIMLAESRLGQAFDPETEELTDPTKLDDANAAYLEVLDTADLVILKGRASEGLGGVANYKKDKEATCTYTAAASGHYEQAGAADYLQEGPRLLAQKWRCG